MVLTTDTWTNITHSNMNEINQQFQIAFNRMRTSGESCPNIDDLESRVASYLKNCDAADVPAIMLQSELHKIIREIRMCDSLSNHGYLSLAHQEFVLNQKKARVHPHMTAEMRSHIGLADHIRGKHAIREEKKDEEPSWDDHLDDIEKNSDELISKIDDLELEDIVHLYNDSEVELDEAVLDEHLSRQERIRRKAQMNKSKSKMERRRAIALTKMSSSANLTRKARRLAIEMIKEKLSKKKPGDLSVAEKDRLEDMIAKRKNLVNRLATKLAVKIKKIEQDRVMHNREIKEDTLNEVILVGIGKHEKFDDDIFYGKHNDIHTARDYLTTYAKEEDLGKVGEHTNVSKFEDPHRNKGHILTHDANGVVHHVMTYERPYKESPNTLVVKTITGNDYAHKELGAHDLYHHLLNKGHIIQSDLDQSEGGLRVWKKLSRMPGVNVHAWDLGKDEPVNSDRFLRSTEDTHTQLSSGIKDHALMHDIVLVAHK